jgi:D-serine deaminase-like pyridoxal phosphate-dependent protein
MLPGLENYEWLLKLIHKKERYSYFIYGGNWNADFVYPTKITNNKMFGPSANQSMINSNHGALEIDDFVLLRPHQSEAVFLQFGSILAFRKEQIIEWPTLSN